MINSVKVKEINSSKYRYVFGIIFILIGLAITFLPQYVFPVCSGNSGTIMRCFYTAQAMIGLGLIISFAGIMTIAITDLSVLQGIIIMIIPLAIIIPVTAFYLIGICKMNVMQCHTGTKPALYIVSVLLLLISIIFIWSISKNKDKNIIA